MRPESRKGATYLDQCLQHLDCLSRLYVTQDHRHNQHQGRSLIISQRSLGLLPFVSNISHLYMVQLARGLTRTPSGTESNVSLKELHLVTGNTTTYPMDSPVASNSSLGAWYDEGQDKRFVVYQTSDSNRLTELDAIQRSAAIMATNDARAKTSVAAVPFQGSVYLYYADSSDNLRRVTRANGQWGTSGPRQPASWQRSNHRDRCKWVESCILSGTR